MPSGLGHLDAISRLVLFEVALLQQLLRVVGCTRWIICPDEEIHNFAGVRVVVHHQTDALLDPRFQVSIVTVWPDLVGIVFAGRAQDRLNPVDVFAHERRACDRTQIAQGRPRSGGLQQGRSSLCSSTLTEPERNPQRPQNNVPELLFAEIGPWGSRYDV